MLSLVQVTPEHTSDALAPPLLDNHAAKAPEGSDVPSHSTVLSEAATSIVGFAVSSMVKVAVVVVKFPQASVAVKVTVSVPVAPQSSLRPVLSLVQVTPEHASEALAPPLAANHAAKAPEGSDVPSHCTVLFAAAVVKVGTVVSSIVKVASSVILLVLESVRVKVTVSVPVAPQSSLKPVLSFVTVTTVQLSDPVNVLFNQSLNSVVLPDPSH